VKVTLKQAGADWLRSRGCFLPLLNQQRRLVSTSSSPINTLIPF